MIAVAACGDVAEGWQRRSSMDSFVASRVSVVLPFGSFLLAWLVRLSCLGERRALARRFS